MKAVGQQSQKLSSLTKEAEIIAEKFESQQADIDRKKVELEQKMEQMQLQDVELLATQNQLNRVQQLVQERRGAEQPARTCSCGHPAIERNGAASC
jgi:pectin methylesterase-like acyl-CoA thioesterase